MLWRMGIGWETFPGVFLSGSGGSIMRGNVRGMNLGLLVVVVLVVIVAGCSKDKGPTRPVVDGVAPSAVVDLSAVSPTSSSLALTWTATGDDTTVGRASQYDIRYCRVEITAANWDSVGVVPAVGEPVPGEAGSRESFVVAGLSAGTVYYFAMKVGDERPNWSGMSNVASGTTRAGSGWFALGSGMNSGVCALAVYNGQLIAGGYFTTAGGVSANCIAAWDGSSWSPLGTGMNGHVFALAEYNGRLIAGGYFTTAGGVSANYIAVWDGSSWSPLGSGMGGVGGAIPPGVHALTEYNGHLIAGGDFTTAGGASANYIAAWDGSSWSPLGTGMSSSVYALAVYNGQLTAGGYFTRAADVRANRIAVWDGSWWCPLGSGMNWEVQALAEYNGQLIAGGYFTTAGGASANQIAAWDGGSWSPLGTGMGGGIPDFLNVAALAEYNRQLIAGGYFITAGGVSVNGIAGWSD
jgi:hypothetical protein